MKNLRMMLAACCAAFICTGVAAEDVRGEPVNAPVASEQANASETLLDKLIDLIRGTDRGG